MISGISSMAATSAPCRGPAPPKATSAKRAGIDAFLNGARADRIGHIGVDQSENALRRLVDVEPELRREFADGAARSAGVELHAAAEKIMFVETAEDEIGVRHRRFDAATPIGGRAGNGAGAAWADPEGAALIDEGDRAASGADRMNIDHRHQQGEPGDRGRARIRLARICRRR